MKLLQIIRNLLHQAFITSDIFSAQLKSSFKSVTVY
jgi:hypothetical protein